MDTTKKKKKVNEEYSFALNSSFAELFELESTKTQSSSGQLVLPTNSFQDYVMGIHTIHIMITIKKMKVNEVCL
jgi:hypothetical protein